MTTRTNRRAKKSAIAKKASALATQAAKAKALSLATRERKLAALIALIRRRQASIAEDFYDIGEALRTILRDDLASAREMTFDQLVETELGMDRSAAYKLVRIVDGLPRERAVELGREKSYALVSYAAATPADDTARELADVDAMIAGAPLSELGANDVKRAAAKLRAKKRPAPAADVRAKARAVVATIRALDLPKPEVEIRGRTIRLTIEVPERE